MEGLEKAFQQLNKDTAERMTGEESRTLSEEGESTAGRPFEEQTISQARNFPHRWPIATAR